MRLLLAALALTFSVTCQATFKIAVIDSGFRDPGFKYLCDEGHYDFIDNTPTIGRDNMGAPPKSIADEWPSPDPSPTPYPTPDPNDIDSDFALHIEWWHIGHGTNIVRAINAMIHEPGDYCFLIYKIHERADWAHGKTPKYKNIQSRIAAAILAAIDAGANVINLSSGGIGYPSKIEKQALLLATESGVKVFTVAGNEKTDLNKKCNYYPACYNIKGVEVIGGLAYNDETKTLGKASYSDTGKIITKWDLASYEDYHGTSQACARACGKYVNRKLHEQKDQVH